jgi:ABC-type Mn2+/Zn2+ transport system permease subunit
MAWSEGVPAEAGQRQHAAVLEAVLRSCHSRPMQNIVNKIVQSPVARALILIVLIIPIGCYLGTIPVRRGILYYLGVFAPSVVMAIAAGLWTWSWKWFWVALAICLVLTAALATTSWSAERAGTR